MEIIKSGICCEEVACEASQYNSVYPATCNDVGCVCDDCVDGG